MAKLEWIIVCEKAISEAETKLVSLITIIERISVGAEGLPPVDPTNKKAIVIPHRMNVVSKWVRSDPKVPEKRYEMRSRLIGTNGKPFGEMTSVIDLEQHLSVRVASGAPGFVWTGFGLLTVEADLRVGDKWKRMGRTHVEIRSSALSSSAATPAT